MTNGYLTTIIMSLLFSLTKNVRRDPFDINEAIASLDRKQLVVVWERLQSKCTTALLGFEEEGEDDEQAKVSPNLSLGWHVTQAPFFITELDCSNMSNKGKLRLLKVLARSC